MESEKVKVIKACLDRAVKYYQSEFGGMCLTYINELESENERLKNRVAELEKENKENNSYAKGYADGIKNTYEVVVPDKLKQFAERLKEKATVLESFIFDHRSLSFPEIKILYFDDIDKTLKEFLGK